MKTNNTQTRIRLALVVVSLMISIGVGASLTGFAQDRNNRRGRNNDGYGNYGGSFQLRQTALNAGYNEGVKDYQKNRGRGIDFRDQKAYQQATKDYSSRLGDRELYRRYFREAYENGFNAYNAEVINSRDNNNRARNNDNRDWNRDNNNRDRNSDNRDWNRDNNNNDRRGRNWDRYGTYGGSFELRQTALNAGYNEGIRQGRDDRKRGRQPNYRNNSKYQQATEDYSTRLGDRELYRRYYREGYENGYDAGINGY
jgi:hypothetical protein